LLVATLPIKCLEKLKTWRDMFLFNMIGAKEILIGNKFTLLVCNPQILELLIVISLPRKY